MAKPSSRAVMKEESSCGACRGNNLQEKPLRHLTICQTLGFRHLIAVGILSLALSVQAQPGTAQDTAQHPMPVAGTTQSVTYHNPIAYLSLDGNVYITSLDGT